MEVMRIFKSKTLAVCVCFWIAGAAVGYASSLSHRNLRCGSFGKIRRSNIILNARNRLGERQKSLRSNRNRHLTRIRNERSKINKKMRNFSNGAGFLRENP